MVLSKNLPVYYCRGAMPTVSPARHGVKQGCPCSPFFLQTPRVGHLQWPQNWSRRQGGSLGVMLGFLSHHVLLGEDFQDWVLRKVPARIPKAWKLKIWKLAFECLSFWKGIGALRWIYKSSQGQTCTLWSQNDLSRPKKKHFPVSFYLYEKKGEEHIPDSQDSCV